MPWLSNDLNRFTQGQAVDLLVRVAAGLPKGARIPPPPPPPLVENVRGTTEERLGRLEEIAIYLDQGVAQLETFANGEA